MGQGHGRVDARELGFRSQAENSRQEAAEDEAFAGGAGILSPAGNLDRALGRDGLGRHDDDPADEDGKRQAAHGRKPVEVRCRQSGVDAADTAVAEKDADQGIDDAEINDGDTEDIG